jgi:hypothetical protein
VSAAFASGAESFEPELEFDLVVAPARRGAFVVVGGFDDGDLAM